MRLEQSAKLAEQITALDSGGGEVNLSLWGDIRLLGSVEEAIAGLVQIIV